METLNSRDNPADDASQGLHVDSFLRSRWLKGPEKTEREWPKTSQSPGEIPPDDPEVKKEYPS